MLSFEDNRLSLVFRLFRGPMKLTFLILAWVQLQGCAFSTVITVVAAAPALETLTNPRRAIKPYVVGVNGMELTIRKAATDSCPRLPRDEARASRRTHCAVIVFPRDALLDLNQRLDAAKLVVARNEFMEWSALSDEEVKSRNSIGKHEGGSDIATVFFFPYISLGTIKQVFGNVPNE